MAQATTIKEVLKELDIIIEQSIKENSRIGFFAYVYRRTTAEIASEIALGNFENNQRLETFDVVFANLYLKAYEAHKNNQPNSAAWTFTFDKVQNPLTILQHIMLGMNAHINLDLAIATASTMAGSDIKSIENDFNKVNDILFQITNELQDRLSKASPLLFVLDWLGSTKDEQILDFSMRKARKQAWNSAQLLWTLGESQNEVAKIELDHLVVKLSEIIESPKTIILRFLLKVVRFFETKKVALIINKLKAD
jgi:hypothetical protein